MKLTDTGILRILVAEEGYRLYSSSDNQYYNKVYLGKNDSEDNYREVEDPDYVKPNQDVETVKLELEETKERLSNCEEMLDVSLCATDEIYTMIAPLMGDILNGASVEDIGEVKILDDNTIQEQPSNPLGEMYFLMIKRGLKNIEDIPTKYKDYVTLKLKNK